MKYKILKNCTRIWKNRKISSYSTIRFWNYNFYFYKFALKTNTWMIIFAYLRCMLIQKRDFKKSNVHMWELYRLKSPIEAKFTRIYHFCGIDFGSCSFYFRHFLFILTIKFIFIETKWNIMLNFLRPNLKVFWCKIQCNNKCLKMSCLKEQDVVFSNFKNIFFKALIHNTKLVFGYHIGSWLKNGWLRHLIAGGRLRGSKMSIFCRWQNYRKLLERFSKIVFTYCQ